MGDRQHLAVPCELPQLPADHVADTAADAGVDLVEDEGRMGVGAGQRRLDGQHDPGRLPSRGDLRQGPERLPGVEREQELHGLGHPVPAPGRRRLRGDPA